MSISMSLGPFPWLILIGISKQDFLTWTPSSLLGLPPSTGVPGWDRSCCRRNVTEYSGKFVTKNVKMIFWNLGAPPWEFVGRRGRRRWWWCGVATLSPHLEDSNIHILNSISNNLTLTERRLSVRNLFGRGRGASVKKSNIKKCAMSKGKILRCEPERGVSDVDRFNCLLKSGEGRGGHSPISNLWLCD